MKAMNIVVSVFTVVASVTILVILMVAGTQNAPLDKMEPTITTQGEAITVQRISEVLPNGIYRYVDTENKIVVYLTIAGNGNSMTSQKVGK